MTLAKVMPKLAQFVPLAEESYDKASRRSSPFSEI